VSIIEFGPFRLDPAERLLLRDGHPVALTPKAFDLLRYLAERHGRLVEKQAIMTALWPDTIVEEGNLASTVSALRKALGDDGGEQRVIATVPTRGYRFVMPLMHRDTPLAADAPGQVPDTVHQRRTRFTRRAAGIALWSVVMIGAGWWLSDWRGRPPAPVSHVRVGITPADGIRGPDLHGERAGGRNRPTRTAIALSADGRHIVFAGLQGEKQQLWLRSLDRAEAMPIAGTEQAAAPFFSPDGRWIGFWSRHALWKVPAAGGAPIKICDARGSYGASWGPDDSIVFADGLAGGLQRVSAGGGAPQPLTTVNASEGEGSHRWPHVLPGGKAVLFTVVAVPREPRLGTHVALLALDTGKRRMLLKDAADARYVSTGHLLYVARERLLVAPFDLRTLEVTSDPVGVIDGVMQSRITAAAQFAASDSGSLAWLPAVADHDPEQLRTIVWVDGRGRSTPIDAAADAYFRPRLAPDGQRIAVDTVESVAAIWIHDLRRSTRTRLPFDGYANSPLWTPDGQRLVFSGARTGNGNLFWIPADGSGPAERLATSESAQYPASWSRDGRTLVFEQCGSQCDIWALSTNGKEWTARPVVATPAVEVHATLSPDGHWLAYMSLTSGRQEVYVQPFPGPGERQQVSSEGGAFPRWSPDGRRLYYCATHDAGPFASTLPLTPRSGHTYFVVDVSTSPTFSASPSRVWFEDPEAKYTVTQPIAGYDVAPDGRFLMVEVKRGPGIVPPPPSDLRLIMNWSEHLRSRVAAR
jgi:serine/threonine-protein kinase